MSNGFTWKHLLFRFLFSGCDTCRYRCRIPDLKLAGSAEGRVLRVVRVGGPIEHPSLPSGGARKGRNHRRHAMGATVFDRHPPHFSTGAHVIDRVLKPSCSTIYGDGDATISTSAACCICYCDIGNG
jgi:hypothetical protein